MFETDVMIGQDRAGPFIEWSRDHEGDLWIARWYGPLAACEAMRTWTPPDAWFVPITGIEKPAALAA